METVQNAADFNPPSGFPVHSRNELVILLVFSPLVFIKPENEVPIAW